MLALFALVFGLVALAYTAPFPFLLEAFKPSGSLWSTAGRRALPTSPVARRAGCSVRMRAGAA